MTRKFWFVSASLVAVLSIGVVGCSNKNGSDSMNMSGGDKSMGMSQPTTNPMSATYTCTMHPEIVQSQPGKCPKCGMSLVQKK